MGAISSSSSVPVGRISRYCVSVRCRCSDGDGVGLIVSTIDSGHLGALHGWEEGSEEADLV